jgi:hypothetical protein
MTRIAWCTVFSAADEQARRSEAAARLLAETHPVTLWHAPLSDPIDSPLPQVSSLGVVGNSIERLAAYESIVYWLGNDASSDVEQFILRDTFEQLPGVLVGTEDALLEDNPGRVNRATAILVTNEHHGRPSLNLALTPLLMVSPERTQEVAEGIERLILAGDRITPLRRLSSELADVLGYFGINGATDVIDDLSATLEQLFGDADINGENDPQRGDASTH